VLPSVLREFLAEYPGISISLRELAAEDLFDSIRRREVDFGIGVQSPRTTEFNFRHLFDEPIYAIATKAFPFRRRASVDLAELCAYPVLLNSKSTALRNQLERALAAKNLLMDIRFEVAHTHTLSALATAGIAVGILPRIALPSPLNKKLQAAPISNPVLSRSVSIVTLRGQSLSPAAKALTDTLQKFLEEKLV
jgi:DNA-binding transcriptional LysR family regulator